MSRTYRRSYIEEWYSNIEAYQASVETPWYCRWTREFVVEEFDANEYFEHFRDHNHHGKTAHTRFRNAAKKELRVKNKRMMRKIKKDVDLAEIADYPSDHHFKHLIWCYD